MCTALPRSLSVVTFLPLLAAMFLGGCGNLTAGGFGEAVVAVSGDATAASAAPASVPPAFTVAGADGEPEGEVEVEFLLYLEGADGSSTTLSDEELRIRVDLRGRREAEAVNRQVPAMRYTALRIVFTEIKAEVDDGLVINGQVVSGAVEVELKDTTLTVVRPLSLDIEDGDRVELLVDLNAAVWLQAVDPDLNKVAERFFSDALALVVR